MRREENEKRIIAGKRTFTFTILISIICWFAGYMDNIGFPVADSTHPMPLWRDLCNLILGKETAYFIGFIFMLGGAFLIHRINYMLNLIREKTVLPFLFFVLFMSTNPDFFSFKSALISVICLLLGMYQLFLSYHNPADCRRTFDWAALIALGSLFWVQIVWFYPLFWFGMYHLRSLSFRSFIASLLGAGTVYWFLLGWCVWIGNFSLFTGTFGSLFDFRVVLFKGGILSLIGIGYMLLLTLVASFNILAREYADNLRTREYLSFLIAFAAWALLFYFLYDYSSEDFLAIACVPISILLGHFFTVGWNKWLSYLFFFTVILFITILFIRLWTHL